MLYPDIDRMRILSAFPSLHHDINWKINSPEDGSYNCLAYAAVITDKFFWPGNRPEYTWHKDVPMDTQLPTLILFYEKHEFIECENFDFENGYQKIALYIKDDEITHAARQLSTGLWCSKLGPSHDIIHSNPYTVEGNQYGRAVSAMKREHPNFYR